MLPVGASATIDTEIQYYRGEGIRDRDSFVEFDAIRQGNRTVGVTNFFFTRLDVKCSQDITLETGAYELKRELDVNRRGRFGGEQMFRLPDAVYQVRVRGTIRNDGKASGKLRVASRGEACKARWRARPKGPPSPAIPPGTQPGAVLP